MKRWRWSGIVSLAGWLCLTTTLGASSGVRVSETEESLELEYRSGDTVVKDRLPLYRVGRVRYFSAGVGAEERSIEYPPFALKIVFTAGGTAYVTGPSVVIQKQSGEEVVSIPAEHVTGPWLFVDLPNDAYRIEATMEGNTVRLSNIKVEPDKQTTVHMRWANERKRS